VAGSERRNCSYDFALHLDQVRHLHHFVDVAEDLADALSSDRRGPAWPKELPWLPWKDQPLVIAGAGQDAGEKCATRGVAPTDRETPKAPAWIPAGSRWHFGIIASGGYPRLPSWSLPRAWDGLARNIRLRSGI